MINVQFENKIKNKDLIICLYDDYKNNENFNLIDKELDGFLSEAIKKKDFKTDFGNTLSLISPQAKYQTIIILACAKHSKLDNLQAEKIGAKIVDILKANKITEVSVISDYFNADIAMGIHSKAYSFNKYKSEEKLKDNIDIENINFVSVNAKSDNEHYQDTLYLAQSLYYTRDLVSQPPNMLNPETYSDQVKKDLSKLGIKIEILDSKKMQKLGMNALLGVGQGSKSESKLVIMRYEGGKSKDKPLAFIGKGVTFDSGGLSLKPSSSMEDMKYDMAGSAVVVGLMRLLAQRKAKVNAVGLIGLVENMPDGNAQRPGDVVRSMSGQTIEILNTDAEGRLVLADVLWYCQERFKPQFMINLATLTGAIVVALGNEYAGLFSNNDELSEKLTNAGVSIDEKLWRMPLHKVYDKDIDSDIADVRNTQKTSGSAGSITAAQFLQRFVNNTPWAHLDIAGVTWNKAPKDIVPKGATGFGVKLLNHFIKINYE